MLIPVKTDLTSTLPAAQFNEITTELQTNLITTSGQTPSSGALDQVGTAVASYAAQGSVFGTDSGAADAYVFTQISPFLKPYALRNGMTIKFRAANANTGACTVNPFGLGIKAIKLSDGSTNPAVGQISTTQDTELRYDGTVFRLNLPNLNFAKLTYQVPSGTDGGTSTAGSFQTRPLNTEVLDPNGIVTLLANQFTLAAGTYKISSRMCMTYSSAAGSPAAATSRIRNITDSTTPTGGIGNNCSILENSFAGAAIWLEVSPFIITIAGSKAFELQYFSPVGQASTGLGEAVSSGENEVYASITIEKIY